MFHLYVSDSSDKDTKYQEGQGEGLERHEHRSREIGENFWEIGPRPPTLLIIILIFID